MKPIKIIPKSNDEWLELRKHSIGGSEVSAICGQNPFSSPLDIFLLKTGRKEYQDINWSMKVGKSLEDGVVDLWKNEYNKKVLKNSKADIIYVHPDYPYMTGTFDRFYYLDEGGKGILEIKTTKSIFDYDEIPMYWVIQLQWYLGISGCKKGTLVWFEFRTTELKCQEFDFNEELFASLVDITKDFWENYVLKDVTPEPINSNDILNLYLSETEGKEIEATEEIQNLYEEIKQLGSDVNPKLQRIEDIKETVKVEMKDAERIRFFDQYLFTWKTNKAGNRIFRIK